MDAVPGNAAGLLMMPVAVIRRPSTSHGLGVMATVSTAALRVLRRVAPQTSLMQAMAAAGLSALLALFLAALLHTAGVGVSGTIAGAARAVDGDTLVINGERIRLYGIDAPESAQQCLDGGGKPYACGLVSKDALAKKIGSSPVTCRVKNTDVYGRSVSVCGLTNFVGSLEDLNAWLVDNGYAVAYRLLPACERNPPPARPRSTDLSTPHAPAPAADPLSLQQSCVPRSHMTERGRCFRASAAGVVVVRRQYGKEYVPHENTARAARRGVWAGRFQMPADWRKENKR